MSDLRLIKNRDSFSESDHLIKAMRDAVDVLTKDGDQLTGFVILVTYNGGENSAYDVRDRDQMLRMIEETKFLMLFDTEVEND